MNRPVLVTGTVVATVALVLLVVNFMGGEKEIERRVTRVHAMDHPHFAHELGAILGPAMVGGNRVHVLLDWVGSAKMDESLMTGMLQAGVQIRKFHPPHWSHLGRLNNRTHRKILVADGRTAFTGGVGIAPQ